MRRRKYSRLSLAALGVGFFALVLLVTSAGRSGNIARADQWTTQVGAGLIAPACGSSSLSNTSGINGGVGPACSNGAPYVTINWSPDPASNCGSGWANIGLGPYVVASVAIDGAVVASGLPTTGSYTWTGGAVGTSHTYDVSCYISYLPNNVDDLSTGSFTLPGSCPVPPTVTGVTINSSTVVADGVTQYTITETATDTTGGTAIKDELALVDYNLTTGDPAEGRGYLQWSKNGDFPFNPANGQKTPPGIIACTGGGSAIIQSSYGYGPQYINLYSCATSVAGNTRTVSYVVSFNGVFTAPTTGNTLNGYARNDSALDDGWKQYPGFSLGTPPGPPNIIDVTISSPSVYADGATPYTVTVTATDALGGDTISEEQFMTNYQGVNTGSYRGYVGWSKNSDFAYFPGTYKVAPISCTGGGSGAISTKYDYSPYFGFGYPYINLVSCSTSVVGTTRTSSFVVNFDPSFTAPTANNTLSGRVYNAGSNQGAGWTAFNTYALNPPLPTVMLSANPTTIDAGQSSTLTWTSTNATGCTFVDTGAVATSGTRSVSPSVTSTYQISCAGPGGTSAPKNATVTVLQPNVAITAAPSRVVSGASTNVAWNASNVNSCIITRNGVTWKTLTADASRNVVGNSADVITGQTSYVMTCASNASVAAASATQIVNLLSVFTPF